MKILILGGGVGGQVASNLLGKRLDKKHDVVVVDKRAQFEFEASFPWVMMGRRKPHQITRNLSLLEKRGVKFVNGEVLKIDLAERIVKTQIVLAENRGDRFLYSNLNDNPEFDASNHPNLNYDDEQNTDGVSLGRGSWTWDASIPYVDQVFDPEDDFKIRIFTE